MSNPVTVVTTPGLDGPGTGHGLTLHGRVDWKSAVDRYRVALIHDLNVARAALEALDRGDVTVVQQYGMWAARDRKVIEKPAGI